VVNCWYDLHQITKNLFNVFNQEKHHHITNDVLTFGQSEPAPTSAPKWMDGALMGAPFSSLPGLAKVANLSWPFLFPFLSLGQFFLGTFFFLTPHTTQVSPTYLHLDYLPMHPGLLPPPSNYLHAHLPTHLSTYPPICLPTHPKPIYLCTYALNLYQGNDDASQWRYCNIPPGRLLRSPSYLPTYYTL